jgi:PIN domain nuclease of toxin-antitoxin system
LNFLLDTHILIWLLDGNPKIGEARLELIREPTNTPVVSIASLWEMSVKMSIGKLTPIYDFKDLVQNVLEKKGLQILSILPTHLDVCKSLPLHHRDPFDRLMISQAIAEDLPIMSEDELFKNYSVRLI